MATPRHRHTRTRSLRSTFNTIGNVVIKGAEKAASNITEFHDSDYHFLRSNLMESRQNVNLSLAELALYERRISRTDYTLLGFCLDWVIDHLLYVWDVLWGVIKPILSYIIYSLFTAILMVLFFFILFYTLHLVI